MESLETYHQAPAAAEAAAVLTSIRAIIRASDVQSKQLQKVAGLTTAQAVCLSTVAQMGEVTTSALAKSAALSQPTVTAILDRLAARGLIERYRSTRDRRKVHARLTALGEEKVATLPSLLAEKFTHAFTALSPEERAGISSALGKVARMMDVDAYDAAPTVNGFVPADGTTKRS